MNGKSLQESTYSTYLRLAWTSTRELGEDHLGRQTIFDSSSWLVRGVMLRRRRRTQFRASAEQHATGTVTHDSDSGVILY